MKNVFFRDTGFAHGVKVKCTKTAATKSGNFYILSVSNSDDGNDKSVVFANQDHLEDLQVPENSVVNLSFPIKCSEFTLGDTAMSVVYVDLDDA
tara:strand:- start:67 stop:348 length:282 start_codon:yes stop_codon:yes gene_type:complete